MDAGSGTRAARRDVAVQQVKRHVAPDVGRLLVLEVIAAIGAAVALWLERLHERAFVQHRMRILDEGNAGLCYLQKS